MSSIPRSNDPQSNLLAKTNTLYSVCIAYHMYSALSLDCYCCPHCQHVHANENKRRTLPEVTRSMPMHKTSKHTYSLAKLEILSGTPLNLCRQQLDI